MDSNAADFAGFKAPLHLLKQKGLLNEADDLTAFFSESCLPGAPPGTNLCKLCVGNIASDNDEVKAATKCSSTNAEYYNGGKGALR